MKENAAKKLQRMMRLPAECESAFKNVIANSEKILYRLLSIPKL